MAKRKPGRPKGPNKVTLNLYVRPSVIRALKSAARADEVSASQYVERMLRRKLKV